MKKIGPNIEYFLAELSGNQDRARINIRARQVRDRYAQVIQAVYRQTAQLFLDHTNNVYIMNKEGVRTLIVYVDESIYAAELNAQRELIKLKLLQMFKEEVEEFQILVSRGKYKQNHPYAQLQEEPVVKTVNPAPLSQNERERVSLTVASIDEGPLKKSVEKAMTAAMALNKAENDKTELKTSK